MVSFSCAKCGDVVKKPKVISHAGSCGTNSYSCVDCMQVFDLNSIAKHTSCMSEVQKYQGKWVPDFTKPVAKDSDSDDEETKKKAHTMQRKSRPKLSFTDSDDSDADTKRVPKKTATKVQSKRSRDSDDSEDECKPPVVLKAKPRTASPASVSKKSPKLVSSKIESLRLPASNVAPPPTEYTISGEPIPLGTHELIGEIVDEIIAEQKALNNNSKPTAGVIGQELVLRYRKRLGKVMAKAIAPVLAERGL